MNRHKHKSLLWFALLSINLAGTLPLRAQTGSLDNLLNRTGISVNKFLDQLGSVTCTEEVLQEKFDPKGKTEERLQSSYEYLVLLQNQGSEPLLYESRQTLKAPHSRKDVSLLVSNGFATQLLIFHPFYQPSFTFERLADVQENGKAYAQVHFLHVKGRPTPAALQLRGRDYPLSLAGTALIDPETGFVERIRTDLGISMDDLGLKRFHSEVDYAAFSFPQQQAKNYWLPNEAVIEVETPKQHWKNVHRFTSYHLFSVNTSQESDTKKIGQSGP